MDPHKKNVEGLYNIIDQNGFVYAADSIKVAPEGAEISLNGLNCGTVGLDTIDQILEITNRSPSMDDIGVLQIATMFKALDSAFKLLGRTEKPEVTIFGATSLSLTILPTRTSEDVDIIATAELVEIFNEQNFTHIPIEVLDSSIAKNLGAWETRTSSITGTSANYKIMHPFDTLMQKLLRTHSDVFVKKDMPDIKEIIQYFKPPTETVIQLLRENPSRYIVEHFSERLEKEATIQNTKLFLSEFYPCIDSEQLISGIVNEYELSTGMPCKPLVESLEAIDISTIYTEEGIDL